MLHYVVSPAEGVGRNWRRGGWVVLEFYVLTAVSILFNVVVIGETSYD